MTTREGGCQCGAVRYRIQGDGLVLTVCHCTECQRQSGSAFGMSLTLLERDFELLRGELRTFTRKAESGRSVDCAFCPGCGIRIFHRPSYVPGILNVKPGTLDDRSWLMPKLHSWTISKQEWVALPEAVPALPKQGDM